MNLKIIKIKPWMIKFKIDDKIYFIKDGDDAYEHYKTLYRYIPTDDKGHYKTEALKGSFGDLNISDFVVRKPGQTYSQIDPERFFAALSWYLFGEAVGMSKDDVERYNLEHRKNILKDKIKRLERELSSSRLDLFILEHPEEYERN